MYYLTKIYHRYFLFTEDYQTFIVSNIHPLEKLAQTLGGLPKLFFRTLLNSKESHLGNEDLLKTSILRIDKQVIRGISSQVENSAQ